MRSSIVLLALAVVTGSVAAQEPGELDAVLINISEDDLNRIVRGAFRENGGPSIEGARTEVSSRVSDLSYRADFSEPVLRLGEDGRASLDLGLIDADVRIGRVQRKFMGRMASCENTGVHVSPDEPVDIQLDFRFAIRDRDLTILADELRLENTRGFKLQKPTKCRNTVLPKWLVWWLGKSRIRRQVDRLDDVLLDKAESGAAALNEKELLRKEWSELELYPHRIDTSKGSLLVTLAGTTLSGLAGSGSAPEWVSTLAKSSFLGFSESFLNTVLRTAASRLPHDLQEPGGGMAKLFRSSSIYALIPGLREIESPEELRFKFSVHDAPRIEIVDVGGGTDGVPDALEHASRAMIRLRLSGIEIGLWESEDDKLGSIHIDSATLGVMPYLSPIGGISFEAVENEWSVSSDGIELDEETLAAVLQELFFGSIFETGYDPIARGALDVGETAFNPRYFSRIGRHLVVGLTGF